ncbi:DUF805 domain-containing protein [Streptomyces blattellae]|uniref:DUF805 domain-containing protein n=1 Tax=Streptomyces blattellae TaxID=2569855 RepID=UPI0038B4D6EE
MPFRLRRMHDCGRSGWAWFSAWIPLARLIVVLGLRCERGDPKTKGHGLPPGTKANW